MMAAARTFGIGLWQIAKMFIDLIKMALGKIE